jgi:hypothetical protein
MKADELVKIIFVRLLGLIKEFLPFNSSQNELVYRFASSEELFCKKFIFSRVLLNLVSNDRKKCTPKKVLTHDHSSEIICALRVSLSAGV